MAEVKFKITNNDPLNPGKKLVAFLTNAPLCFGGYPVIVQWVEKVKENNETTDAPPAGTTDRQKDAVRQKEQTFTINGRKIDSITKLYLPDDTQNINAITLADHFATKLLTTFPGVGGGSQAWEFAEGILREVIEIKQANGELPPTN